MTPRRFFSGGERVALYLAADGKCSGCGVVLAPGWHADHVNPHSRGGATDVTNGQALCPTCNLTKGNTVTVPLRIWQIRALARFRLTDHDFLCVATPGAGKTRFALAASQNLMDAGKISKLIIVVPTEHLKNQWAEAAHRDFGIQLDPDFRNSAGVVAADFAGPVVTFQQVSSQPALFRRMASDAQTLVIIDEVHHGGDDLSWGNALREAFDVAARRLLLSGTPDRTDRNPVPFVSYDDAGCFVADQPYGYVYGYAEALADPEGVVRTITFPTFDGDAHWLDASAVEAKLRLSDADEKTRALVLRSALMPAGKFMDSMLREAHKDLARRRQATPDAGGLIIASTKSEAELLAGRMAVISGESVTLATSDHADASQRIADFAAGRSPWLCAVGMVSEGVDIPRLHVGVYATTTATSLFFRQIVGRFIRTRGLDDESDASLYIPSVAPLVTHAAEIERMIPQAMQMAEERIEEEAAKLDAEPREVQLSLVMPLPPSEGVHVGTILSGESFSDAELREGEEHARQCGMPGSVTAVQMARSLRLRNGGQTINTFTATVPAPETPLPTPLKDQKRLIRLRLRSRVAYLARLTNQPYDHINGTLNREAGDGVNVPRATLDGLKARLATVEHLIAEQM